MIVRGGQDKRCGEPVKHKSTYDTHLKGTATHPEPQPDKTL